MCKQIYSERKYMKYLHNMIEGTIEFHWGVAIIISINKFDTKVLQYNFVKIIFFSIKIMILSLILTMRLLVILI